MILKHSPTRWLSLLRCVRRYIQQYSGLKSYFLTCGQQLSFEVSQASALDKQLAMFYAELRKEDGSEYEPDSLRVMLSSLDRHFRENGALFSILKDKEFAYSRKILNGKAIELRQSGKGKRKMKADPLTENDEEILWSSGALGNSNPTVLNHTIWYVIGQQFGTRGVQEHLQMKVEDFKWVLDPHSSKVQYVEWTEGLTKTRQGGLVKSERRVPQRLFPNGTDHCPVKLLELLISKRPPKLRTSGALYLTPLRKLRECLWYSVQSVGEGKIKTYMKTIVTMAGIGENGRRFTNHSVRKTTVRKLQKAGVSNDKIASITGHQNEESLRSYAVTDMSDHEKISLILSKKTSSTQPQPQPNPATPQPIPSSVPPPTPFNQPSSMMPAFVPEHISTNRHPLVPLQSQCYFSNCTVYMGNSKPEESRTVQHDEED